jgi:hypothetical protein
MKTIQAFIVLFLLVPIVSLAQNGTILPTPDTSIRLRVSLLTVGVGDEIYASFGHTGIRIIDSSEGSDMVYNWGTFDGFQEGFETKFMRGKLLYYASAQTFVQFMSIYVHEQRGVEEQQLFLSASQKRQLQSFIDDNLREENKYYKYDFLFDNCATRPRDVFPQTFGPSFKYGRTLPADKQVTFRDEIKRYLAHLPWELLGINLLLGKKVDRVMSNEDAMFLPDYLRDGLGGASVNGQSVAGKPVRLLPPAPPLPQPPNTPFFVMLAFGAFIVVGSAIPGIKPLATIAGYFMLIVTGLLGTLMLFMWIATDHQACQNNFNVLWALPTNLVIPFIKPERRSRYALVAMALIIVSVLLHAFHVQSLPMGEIWPLLLALLAFFGMIYRSATSPAADESDTHHHHHHH